VSGTVQLTHVRPACFHANVILKVGCEVAWGVKLVDAVLESAGEKGLDCQPRSSVTSTSRDSESTRQLPLAGTTVYVATGVKLSQISSHVITARAASADNHKRSTVLCN
jgi:hypothetical protein